MSRGPAKPNQWKPEFLASLRTWPVVATACQAVGIERSTAYRARDTDEEFAAAWDDAMEAGIDRAEQEAFRRAVEGHQRTVWFQGNPVGTETVYSDALLSMVLKGRRKRVYAERTEITGADGANINEVDETVRAARIAALLEAARARKADIEDLV